MKEDLIVGPVRVPGEEPLAHPQPPVEAHVQTSGTLRAVKTVEALILEDLVRHPRHLDPAQVLLYNIHL